MQHNRLLVKLAQESWPWITISTILGFSGAIFNGVGVTLIIPLVLSFLSVDIAGSNDLPNIISKFFAVFEGVPASYRSFTMLACVILAIILKNLAAYASSIVSGHLSRQFTSSLRKQGFRLLLDVDIQFFSENKLGELMNYINSEVGRAAAAVRALINIIISAITIMVFLAILLSISWELTLLASILLGGIACLNQLTIRYAKNIGQELSSTSASYSSRAIELLSGIRLVKSTANEEYEYGLIKNLITRREKAEFKSQIAFSAIGPLNEVLSIFALLMLVVIGRIWYGNNLQVYSSVLITYLFIMTRMLPYIGQLNGARNQLANSSASVEILDHFLDRSSKPIMQSQHRTFSNLKEHIQFKDLWFRYPNSDRWSLKSVNLTLPKGQTLALVGSSGAGKSTLADLLARFYDPNQGSIEIDGVDLREFDPHQYKRKIGIVSQDTFLFNLSVKDNIKYGCPEATDEEVFQAAKRANAVEFIQNLSEGFDTLIGDRGVLLSGGQRQRIAIARALVQNPEILILDEATSALDTVSEKLVQEAIEELSQERTTLVIAHRLSTVQKADQIAVFQQGTVIEVGTHAELLAKDQHYANLYNMQFSQRKTHIQEEASIWKTRGLDSVSFEMRSQLNGMLGIFGLLHNEMIDTDEERDELTERAYQSALNIFQALEKFESQIMTIR